MEPREIAGEARSAIRSLISRSRGRRAVMGSVSTVLGGMLDALYRWIERRLPTLYKEEAEEVSPGYEIAEIDERTLEVIGEQMSEDFAKLAAEMERDSRRMLRALAEERIAEERETLAGNAGKNLARDMREAGIDFVDRSGRRWSPEVYAEMATRTGLARLKNAARLNAAAKQGARGVIVRDNEGPHSCQACKVANGQRWSLAIAAAEPLQHPNCVREFSPIPSTDVTPLDRGSSETNVRAS